MKLTEVGPIREISCDCDFCLQLMKEEKELDLQIEKYQIKVEEMKKEIFKISRKKKKLSNALEANRARDSLVRLDGRQCLSQLFFPS
jgi:hypothetical protein